MQLRKEPPRTPETRDPPKFRGTIPVVLRAVCYSWTTVNSNTYHRNLVEDVIIHTVPPIMTNAPIHNHRLWHSSRLHPWIIRFDFGASGPAHTQCPSCKPEPQNATSTKRRGSIIPRSQSRSALSLQEQHPGVPGNHLTSTCHPHASSPTKNRELDILHFI